MELLARANELASLGHDVIHLGVGEPDFDTPAPILAAGVRAISEGKTRYTDARGTPELRQAISSFYKLSLGVDVSEERIFVTAGASGGLLMLSALLLNPGENLLIPDPGYPCNRHFLSSFNAEGLLVPVDADQNYQLTPSLVEDYWTSATRGILIASPANPTGSILSQKTIAELGGVVRKRDGIMIVDEIYQGLVYENHISGSALAQVPDAIVINSFSKYFGMTGWRLGWVVVPEELGPDLVKLAQNLFICPSSIAQEAALAAFDPEAIATMEAQKVEFEARRNYLVPALKELGFEIPLMPAGAFYVYAGLPDNAPDAEQFCHRLLESHFVVVTPGTDFGFHNAARSIRISYVRDLSQLKEAVYRIEKMLR
ncbi:MAG: aminotransferase class I/II-fold pyridoxal phosphate-dependent enzyme [Candidatus Azotimanducaceae bacterium WSBS_2022_MAG_OTU7]